MLYDRLQAGKNTGYSFRILPGILFLMMAVLFSIMGVHAAETEAQTTTQTATETSNLLFKVQVKDGYTTQKIDIYETKTAAGKITYGPKAENASVYINMASGDVSLKIVGKTAYFKNQKLKTGISKSVTVDTSKKVKVKLQDSKKKTVGSFKLKLVRVSKPTISSLKADSTTFTPGYGQQKLTVSYLYQLPTYAKLTIKNSKGKIVYTTTSDMVEKASTKENPVSIELTWNGMPSPGNKAGLTLNQYVPDGTYTAYVYIYYTNGKKTKTVSKKISFKTDADALKSSETSPVGMNWPWKMYVTGNKTADYLAEVVCAQVLTPDMTETARARALFNWMASHFKYRAVSSAIFKTLPDKLDYTSAAAKANMTAYKNKIKLLKKQGKAENLAVNNYMKKYNKGSSVLAYWGKNGIAKQVGDCHIIAQTYAILLGHAGIRSDVLEHPGVAYAGRHFWNVVEIGGKWYMADADRPVENNGDVEDYRYFLRGSDFTSKNEPYKTVLNDANYKASVAMMNKKDCPGRTNS